MKKYNRLEEFIKILVNHEKANPEELYPPGISAQFAFDCLVEAFLGPEHYIVLPCNCAQGNTIELDEILRTHSKEYRKLIKRAKKN